MTIITLASRVTQMKPSASIAAKKKVTELQAAGYHIIDFTVGEPDFDTPRHIVDAAVLAMRDGQTHYTATPGTLALRTAIATKLRRENGLRYSSDAIVVAAGAKQIIATAFEATINPGDEVIIPAPFWVSYPEIAVLFGGLPVIAACPESDGFKLTADALDAAITPRTRWLVLNSPNNPTGAVYTPQELKALAQVLLRHPHVMVLTDDIYEHIVFDQVEFATIVEVEPRLADRALVVNGLSKSFAMTGWRVGYGAGPTDLVNAIVKLLGQSTTCACSVSQAAAVAALEGDQTFLMTAGTEYARRRDRMLALLSDIRGITVKKPDGAFYLYPCVAGLIGRTTASGRVLNSDFDVALYLLDTAKVAVLDGGAYGLSPYLRLSFATSMAAIEMGCARIREAVLALS